jgi:mono/diheme cytochrome c family protein
MALLISACATNSFVPPPVSPTLIDRAQLDHATPQQLAAGRQLFASRCLECHTLPSVTKYQRDEWPHLVRRMSARANLTAGEENSIVAYLRAAHP